MSRDGKRPVSVEDLLRLKRAERPAESFWADFDRQLRAKQLAALVEKRPWWHALSLSTFVSGLRRHPVPLGAAVALGVGFFVVRDGRHSVNSQPVAAVVPVAAMVSSPVALVPAVEPAPAVRSVNPAPVASFVAVAATTTAPEIPSEVATVPALIEAGQTAFATSEAESSRSLFVGTVPLSLEAQSSLLMSSSDPVTSGPFLGGGTRVEARAPASRVTVEPLRQITPPADRRGSRILTAMVSMSSVENAMRTTERAASRLSEEQLYDQIRRVGAVGAAVNVKF